MDDTGQHIEVDDKMIIYIIIQNHHVLTIHNINRYCRVEGGSFYPQYLGSIVLHGVGAHHTPILQGKCRSRKKKSEGNSKRHETEFKRKIKRGRTYKGTADMTRQHAAGVKSVH
jgi:hypothetical protein